METKEIEIVAVPYVKTKKPCECGGKLHTVDNGFFSKCFYCEKCENIYIIKMMKLPKKRVNKEFIKECRKEIKRKK